MRLTVKRMLYGRHTISIFAGRFSNDEQCAPVLPIPNLSKES